MPLFQFHQPREPGTFPEDPSHWEFQQTPVGPDGQASSPVPLDTVDSPFYFDCDIEYLQQQCSETLAPAWNPLRQGEALPEDIDACVQANVSECIDILTEDLTYANGWVQVRACTDEVSCSSWSEPIVVPQAPFHALLIVGIIGLAVAARFFGRTR